MVGEDSVGSGAGRHSYRVLNEAEKAQMVRLKDLGLTFIEECERAGTSRELAIARERIEEAVMWAVKHVTK